MNSLQTVMLIEDDDDSRAILAEILCEEGYGVIAAGRGIDAIEILERGPLPDLILLDLVLPDIDGVEVLGVLQHNPRYSEIPIIVVSGVLDAGTLGVAAVLPKPFLLPELLERAQRAIAAHAATAARPSRPLPECAAANTVSPTRSG